MTAANSDRFKSHRAQGKLASGSLADDTTVFSLTLVCYDADDGLVPAEPIDGYRLAGVADGYASTDDGDTTAALYAEGEFQFESEGLEAGDIGRPVYVLDDQTVVLADNANLAAALAAGGAFVYAGKVAQIISDSACWVEIATKGGGLNEPGGPLALSLHAPGVDTAAVSLTTQAATFDGTDFYIEDLDVVLDLAVGGPLTEGVDYSLAAGVLSTLNDQSAAELLLIGQFRLL